MNPTPDPTDPTPDPTDPTPDPTDPTPKPREFTQRCQVIDKIKAGDRKKPLALLSSLPDTPRIDTIYIDLDGVLVDWVRGVRQLASPTRGSTMRDFLDDCRSYDSVAPLLFPGECPAGTMWRLINENGPDWWACLPWTSKGRDLLHDVRDIANQANVDIVFVTSPASADSAAGKVSWLYAEIRSNDRHGKPLSPSYALTPKKHLLAGPGKLLIDDNQETVDAFLEHGGSAILYPQPWTSGESIEDIEKAQDDVPRILAARLRCGAAVTRITIGALIARHDACEENKADVEAIGLADVEIEDTEASRAWAVAVAMGQPVLRGLAGWAVGRLCRPDSVGVRAGATLAGADLRGARLGGADLRGASLEGALLDGALLRGARLEGASLDGATLAGATLAGADLRGASLADADLRGASLAEADLQGADLQGADLRGADMSADLQGADLRGADMSADLRDYARDQGAIVDGGAL